MSKLKLTRRFLAVCLLSTCQLAHGLWPFPSPKPTVRQQVVKAVRNYPVETGLVVVPVATALYQGYNWYKSRQEDDLDDSKMSSTRGKLIKASIGGLTLGGLAYLANKKGYLTSASVKSLVSKGTSFICAHKKGVAVAEGLGLTALAARKLIAKKLIKPLQKKLYEAVVFSALAPLLRAALDDYRIESKIKNMIQGALVKEALEDPEVDTAIERMILGQMNGEQALATIRNVRNKATVAELFTQIDTKVAYHKLQAPHEQWPRADDPEREKIHNRAHAVDSLLILDYSIFRIGKNYVRRLPQ